MQFYFAPRSVAHTGENGLRWRFLIRSETMCGAEIGPKTGPTISRPPSDATGLERKNPHRCRGSPSGASRTRTGDLLGAIQAREAFDGVICRDFVPRHLSL